MDLVQRLQRWFAYDDWANREALASLRAAAAPQARALQVMAHTVAAEALWLDRLRRAPPRLPVWPDLDADGCARHLEALRTEWHEHLGSLDERRLRAEVEYTNSQGQRWRNTVDDVLMHVLLHAAQHRGQVALLLRQNGAEPAYTDFIHCVRQGCIDGVGGAV